MKPVIQEEKTGCGIASAAAIGGLSYHRTKKIANDIGIFADDQALWSDTNHVRRLLSKLGIRTAISEQPFTGWEHLPDCALLAIKWHKKSGKQFWHWVVFIRENSESYVLDSKKSLRNNIRKDFGRMKPKWFIPVILENRKPPPKPN